MGCLMRADERIAEPLSQAQALPNRNPTRWRLLAAERARAGAGGVVSDAAVGVVVVQNATMTPERSAMAASQGLQGVEGESTRFCVDSIGVGRLAAEVAARMWLNMGCCL